MPSLFIAMAITACRGQRILLCEDLSAALFDDGSIAVEWSGCSDDVLREITCTPAAPRYECECIEDGSSIHGGSLSDDIDQALESGNRDAIRASSNAACAWKLQAAD